MRTARDGEWLEHDGVFFGINLGADFVSEHEWGIDKIKKAFGIVGEAVGIARRQIAYCPEELKTIETPGSKIETKNLHSRGTTHHDTILCYYKCTWDRDSEVPLKATDGRWRDSEQFRAAWDEKSFAIRCRPQDDARLYALRNAFASNDIAIWVGGMGIFQNGGLHIVIVSKLPEELKAKMAAKDKAVARLKKASDATGIAEYLRKKGKRHYSLSPHWTAEISEMKSQFEVCYWLNPMDQRNNASGYFSVEDLMAWGDDTGPVVEKKR